MASKIVNLFDKIVDEATDVIPADEATNGASKIFGLVNKMADWAVDAFRQ